MVDEKSVEVVARLVGAYLGNNPVQIGQIPALIASVAASFGALGSTIEPTEPPPVPKVNPNKSIFPDYIVCLDDGKKFRSLRRHLTVLGMTPDEYRQKWGLPSDYPMTAPNYSAARSALAKASGLGRKSAPEVIEKPRRGATTKRSKA